MLKSLIILSLIVLSFIAQSLFAQSGLLLLMDDAEAFTPTSVTSATILGWYDFSDASTVYLTSTSIDSIQDKSGAQDAGLIQDADGTRPELVTGQNSLNVADFTPLQYDGLYDDGFTGFTEVTDEFSVFVVVKFDNVADGETVLECSDNTNYNRGLILYAYASALVFRPDGANEATAAFTNTSTYVIFSGVNTPSTRTYYINGQLQNTNNTTQNMTAAPTRLLLGTLADGATFAFDGKIGEVLIYKGAISEAERVLLETYLNNKWEIY